MTEFHLSCPWLYFPPRRISDSGLVRRHVPFCRRRQHFKLWNCFNGYDRREGRYWGFGVLQIGRRHLLAAIRNSDHPNVRIWIGFVQVARD